MSCIICQGKKCECVKKCSVCGKDIREPYITTGKEHWHEKCYAGKEEYSL